MVQVMQSFRNHTSEGIKILSDCINSSLRAGHGKCCPSVPLWLMGLRCVAINEV